ncbi:MAG: hypothetical protein HQL52_14950 [Magnetococcales bacterium]|nr:hypothetical protein [Magnetococcales bacterium]
MIDLPPPEEIERRETIGRRPFDGHAWFDGIIEDALEGAWEVQDEGRYVVCPKCRGTLH